MFDKFVEQAQTAAKPFSDLMAINTEAMEKLAEHSTGLFTTMMNDSMEFAKELASQKDVAGFYETQKSYAEGVQEKMMTSAKETYSLMTETSEKATEVLSGAFEAVKKFEAAVAPQAPAPAKAKAKAPAKAKAKAAPEA
jgi:phasin family protein